MSHLDPIDIYAEERAKKRQEALSEQQRETIKADTRWLMQDKRGRRFAWRLLERTGVFASSFTGNSETFFREGQRNVGLALLAQIHEHTPELYSVMVKEAQDERAKHADDGSRNDH